MIVLKLNDIYLSDTVGDYPLSNNVGSINSTRTNITWNSIDFQEILGSEIYNKYELFNLRLRFIQYNTQAGFGNNGTERSINFQLSGLNFYNSNYDTGRGCNVGTTTIGTTLFQQTASYVVYDDASIITIRKQRSADINITYITVNNLPPATPVGTMFPRTSFYFDITPIYTDIPKTIEMISTKCSTLYTYYLGNTTNVNQIDMYALLGRENFELGAKYNLVMKSVSADINANYVADMVGYVLLVSSSGMRFQNYETALGKAGGNRMQMLTYNSFQYSTGTLVASNFIRNQTAGIMTFTLEAQICNLMIQLQNTVNNSENTVDVGNSLIVFDIWKCI
jgi:hypothetical protein